MPQKPDSPSLFKGERMDKSKGLIDKDDITASTNYGPWSWKDAQNGMERGITRREDRDSWISGKEYGKTARRDIARAGREREALVAQMMSEKK